MQIGHSGGKFELGQTVMTRGVAIKCEENFAFPILIASCIQAHASGDWGTVCAEDKQENELALEHGNRIVSAYEVMGVKVYVITERDRSVTTVLLPEEH